MDHKKCRWIWDGLTENSLKKLMIQHGIEFFHFCDWEFHIGFLDLCVFKYGTLQIFGFEIHLPLFIPSNVNDLIKINQISCKMLLEIFLLSSTSWHFMKCQTFKNNVCANKTAKINEFFWYSGANKYKT